MADQQFSVPSRALSGIRHINHDHRRGYVKIGNHLAQHRELSMTAIGLATHIQSLPTGSKVTIKALAERFPEGEVRIAAALRELETHGYLARLEERLPSGHVVTCTVSYNNPPARSTETHRERRGPASTPQPDLDADPEPAPAPAPTSEEVPEAEVPEVELQVRQLLARLRLRDPRLVLSERDTVRLAPAAARWLGRGLPQAAVIAALTRALPSATIHSPAALLAHRLREQLPPRIPEAWEAYPVVPDREVHPLRSCEDCDRTFRSPAPGRYTLLRGSGAGGLKPFPSHLRGTMVG
ncbi:MULTISPECIES: helix-turn-helix domain-containing protein [unclassified Streptomyces]|uniref:helix-turn-helix domain-containing protein n=1 Tax=unclassified Streptomyces TaxID=2593676 RepID=UPI0018FF0829|nr:MULTISPECIES: helix-turn-helix domain-containing protein [unclassified Streptomyces]